MGSRGQQKEWKGSQTQLFQIPDPSKLIPDPPFIPFFA